MINRIPLLLSVIVLPAIANADSTIDRGRYISQLANCYACHTDTENDGQAFAGGRLIETEFGQFYTPNITPDKETGIGNWTAQQFINAVRSGESPDGSHYYPTFPYNAYANITDTDINALQTYVFSIPPVNQVNKQHELKWYLFRPLILIWKTINSYLQPSANLEPARGTYVIETLGHCNECHTPRNFLGILQMDQKLTGNEDLSAPDISDKGLKDWGEEELVDLFTYGALPDGDYVSDHMAEVVEFSTSRWKAEDLNAVIRYLKKQ